MVPGQVPGGSDRPQSWAGRGWRRQDTLIAAPPARARRWPDSSWPSTAFYRAAEAGEEVEGATQVVYVSPLKALAVDIHQNLEIPLREIAEVAARLGLPAPGAAAEVRNGDTTASARAAMLRRPPNFLVTTPESLYLLVTAERSRASWLRCAR